VTAAALAAPQHGGHDTPFHWLRNALLALWATVEDSMKEEPKAEPAVEEAETEENFNDW